MRSLILTAWDTALRVLRPFRATLGLILVLALTVTAEAQGIGTFDGQLASGTADGAEVGADIVVVLHVYQGDVEVDTFENTTDADGSFRFAGLDTNPDLEYWPEAIYQGVPYSSGEPYRFDGDQTTLDGTVTVFETTDDDSAVGLDSVHIIAESFGEVLRISEIHLFGNAGDRTYIGRNGETVYIPLPENAVGVAFEEGASLERYVEVEGGFMDTEPVPPGHETMIVFYSYHLMATGGAIPLERRFDYPVANLNILVAQPGLELRSSQMEARGPEIFQGQQYEFYAARNLAADTPLLLELVPNAEVSGGQAGGVVSAVGVQTAAGPSIRGNQELLRWLGFALVAVALIGAMVYPLATKRPASVRTQAPSLSSDPKARRLLAELADLEEGFEAGEVDEAAYRRLKAEIRRKLKSLQP